MKHKNLSLENNLVLLELFSGTGGFAKGFEAAGYKFKKHYFSEVDRYAIANYKYNFKNSESLGDIKKIKGEKIERPHIITFGSPCQDLSLAGKRNGLKGKRSGLFFEAIRLIKEFKPDVFIFENVKGLLSSNGGKDFEVVLKTFADLGLYECQWQLLNTRWVLPQNRERIYLVGCLRGKSTPEVFPIGQSDEHHREYNKEEPERKKEALAPTNDIITDDEFKVSEASSKGYATAHEGDSVNLTYLSSNMRSGRVGKGIAHTLTLKPFQCTFKDGVLRRFTPIESERLQGFPDDWTKFGSEHDKVFVISDTQRYSLLGNAVSVPLVLEIARRLKPIFFPDDFELKGITTQKINQEMKTKSKDVQKELELIERFVAFHNRVINRFTIGLLLDEIERAIQNKIITKASPLAKDIMKIQDALVKQYNEMKNAEHFELKPVTIKYFKKILANSSAGKTADRASITRKIKDVELNGTPNKLATIISSAQFANLEFATIGLKDKWKDFIGDPSPGFTAMVFGMPKMGKSYLCVDFASYLSKNHGKVLYVSKEEFMSPTLALKIKDKAAANEKLDIAGAVPADLSSYLFVFLDSVTSLKLTPDDLKKLEEKYPNISFVYVFQVTKAGSARGTNEYMHNVDVVIEIPEKGKAVQFGRFNQGGNLDIFGKEADTGELAGKRKKYDVISPDGFSIRIGVEPFTSRKAAREYFMEWTDRFKQQGYYSSVPHGKIPLEDLEDYCEWIDL